MCVRSGNTGIGVWAKQEPKNEKKRKEKKKNSAQSHRFQWGDETQEETAFIGRNIEVTYGLG